jgi:hypothetical protein
VSSKEDTFFKGARAQIPMTDFLFCGWVVFLLWEAVLYGSVQSLYNSMDLAWKSRQFWACFSR